MIENPQVGDRVRVVDGDKTNREVYSSVATGEQGVISGVHAGRLPIGFNSDDDPDGHIDPWRLRAEDLERVPE